jgi:hypothetical protein
MSSIHKCVSHFHKIWTRRIKENKGEKNKKNEQPWTLVYTLVLQTMSCPLKCFFWFRPIGFPSKMMQCGLNHNLICFGLEPLSKGLRTNLKFLTNRNAWFHWTLLLGPLSKGLRTNFKFLTNKNAWFHWTLLFGPLSKVVLNIWLMFQKHLVLWSSLTLSNVGSHPKVVTCYSTILVQILLPWQKL